MSHFDRLTGDKLRVSFSEKWRCQRRSCKFQQRILLVVGTRLDGVLRAKAAHKIWRIEQRHHRNVEEQAKKRKSEAEM
jgi:hypothetical protein